MEIHSPELPSLPTEGSELLRAPETSEAARTVETRGSIRSFESHEVDLPSLPPADHGKQAYMVLAGCTLIQGPVWGEYWRRYRKA